MEGDEATVDNTRTLCDRMRWTAGIELLLIDVWQESIEQMRGAQKNTNVYTEMAQSIMEAGYGCLDKNRKSHKEVEAEKTKKFGPSSDVQSLWRHYGTLGPLQSAQSRTTRASWWRLLEKGWSSKKPRQRYSLKWQKARRSSNRKDQKNMLNLS